MDRAKDESLEKQAVEIKFNASSSPLPPISQTSGKLIQNVLVTFVSESYRLAQDGLKDRLAGIRHLFRV